MRAYPYLTDASEVALANELIALYGDGAFEEATLRADRSRDIGNHLHFCRWRQIGRLIDLMADERVIGPVH
ncbi:MULTISPECIES: hypothetical protein [unclassified Sphingomonas]|jgi:hypothetical protein|uniref:hypothetical protein n=1 Tax=unclassified Sphingomonas TaxID=196159 RepID=UPI00082BE645|nr:MULTISPECIES: hypothetical protein [unclassified Sphingomonas]MCH4891714.1 hypothetical protein [Sphingomonas sp. SFZ2018-12]